MKKNGFSIKPYFTPETIQTIYRGAGYTYNESKEDENDIPEDFN